MLKRLLQCSHFYSRRKYFQSVIFVHAKFFKNSPFSPYWLLWGQQSSWTLPGTQQDVSIIPTVFQLSNFNCFECQVLCKVQSKSLNVLTFVGTFNQTLPNGGGLLLNHLVGTFFDAIAATVTVRFCNLNATALKKL